MTNSTIANHVRFFQERKDINSQYAEYYWRAIQYLNTHTLSQNELRIFLENMSVITRQHFFHTDVLETSEQNHGNPFLPARRQ